MDFGALLPTTVTHQSLLRLCTAHTLQSAHSAEKQGHQGLGARTTVVRWQAQEREWKSAMWCCCFFSASPNIPHSTFKREKYAVLVTLLFYFLSFFSSALSPSTKMLCCFAQVASISEGRDPAVWNNDLHRRLWCIYGFDALQGSTLPAKWSMCLCLFNSPHLGSRVYWVRQETQKTKKLHSTIIKQLVARKGGEWTNEHKSIPDPHLSCPERRQGDKQQYNCSTPADTSCLSNEIWGYSEMIMIIR